MLWAPEIEKYIHKAINEAGHKKTAVFDADGTLWPGDCGESFYKYQLKHNPPKNLGVIQGDPEEYYFDWEARDPHNAYAWLAQINAGTTENDLLKLSSEHHKQDRLLQIHPLMQSLVDLLKKNDFEIWVCSASIYWAIAPALLKTVVTDEKHILSTRVEVVDKTLTNKVIEPVPYKDGKTKLLEKNLKEKPHIVVGNSMGDLEMLALAKFPLVVQHLPARREVFESEKQIGAEALKRGWPKQLIQQ
jgi:HAD superfamily phosphoserine phosphatase-like hydrolase